jgi:hypothetical protein
MYELMFDQDQRLTKVAIYACMSEEVPATRAVDRYVTWAYRYRTPAARIICVFTPTHYT